MTTYGLHKNYSTHELRTSQKGTNEENIYKMHNNDVRYNKKGRYVFNVCTKMDRYHIYYI
jgi:hypothetical protein